MPLFDELLLKVARREELSPIELEDFRSQAKRLNEVKDMVESWQQAGRKTPHFSSPSISNPLFLTSALSVLSLQRTTDTSITSGVDTYISWENADGKSKAFGWDSADPTKVKILYPGQAFTLLGRTAFTANATGYRNTKMEAFDSDNNSIGVVGTFYSAPGWTGSDNVNPWVFTIPENLVQNMAYFKLTVGQTSGAPLDLLYILMGMIIA